ncbi:MAG: type II toxin-antitoxin system RelE/ParE family toxin [Gemmataceae bacterium]|nr:type II toxin-antitoxin system RelE/ParE family toxin [Gemmataceae bacterium]
MSKPVRIAPGARDDIREGEAYFDGKRAGLGDEFSDEVLGILDRIQHMPEMYGEVEDGAPTRRFGYVVYYRVHAAESEVLAVLHGSRIAGPHLRRGP